MLQTDSTKKQCVAALTNLAETNDSSPKLPEITRCENLSQLLRIYEAPQEGLQ
jgi:hypothetical protein